MPRWTSHIFTRNALPLLGVLALAIAFPTLGQTPPAKPADKTGSPPPTSPGEKTSPPDPTTPTQPVGPPAPTNPLLDAKRKGDKAPVLPGNDRLPDHRATADPRMARESANNKEPLELFGYSFFEPARQAIEARRLYLRRLLAGELIPGSPTQPNMGVLANPAQPPSVVQLVPPTKEELDAISALTAPQKEDLLKRYGSGQVTEEEKKKYRYLLEINSTPQTPPTTSPMPNGFPPPPAQGTGVPVQPTPGTGAPLPPVPGTGVLPPLTGQNFGSPYLLLQPLTDARAMTSAPGANSLDAYQQVADPLALLSQNISASIPGNYQLSAGDTITLRYWSPTMEVRETRLKVDAQGGITLAEIGRVIVRGQTAAQAEKILRERLRRVFRAVDVTVTLAELRTIKITVSGDSYYPGDYNVPAVVSAINMLYVTGGPTNRGTMRRIEVRRRGSLVGRIDFYKFLLTGENTGEFPLEPGDVIYIPGRSTRVEMRGEVRRPAVYELVDGETLKDALRFAGGVKPSGVQQRVQVLTFQPGAARILKDVDVTKLETSPAVPIYDGDTVEAFSVRTTLINKVTIEGAVDQPGEYEMVAGMSVADLIERARSLQSDAYPTMAHLFRVNSDNTLMLLPVNLEKALARDPAYNLPLQRWDRLTVYTRQQVAFTGRREITVRGAVQQPGVYTHTDNMRLKDLLMQAGGTLPDAYTEHAVLLHQRPDGTYAYDYVNLSAAMQDDPKQNVLVQDRDILAVYTVQEARFTPEHNVSIKGEVTTPGIYPRGEDMRLSDALKLAGGLTPRAGDRIMIAHARTDEGEAPTVVSYSPDGNVTPDPSLMDGDLVTVQGRGEYRDQPYVVTVRGQVNRPGPVIVSGNGMRLSEIINLAGGLKPEAYPEGVDFFRQPERLTTAGQRQITDVINKLNEMINESEHKRAVAKSDIEKLKAVGDARRSQVPISIPGLSTGADVSSPNLPAGANSLFTRELVTPARTLTSKELDPQGNVAVDLAAALRKPGSPDDILVVDGDTITIPERPTTVQVIGAVIHPRAVLFKANEKVEYYATQAGGYTQDAARDRAIVIRIGGGLAPVNKVRELHPGDVIMVPTRVLSEKIESRRNDIDTIFRNLTSSAVIVLVAKKLLGL